MMLHSLRSTKLIFFLLPLCLLSSCNYRALSKENEELKNKKEPKVVKKDKISLMGFSWGATAGLMSIDPSIKKLFSPTQGGFHSLVAAYPNSKYWTVMGRMWRRIADVKIPIPTLILAGEKDEAESIDVYKELQQIAEKNTFPLTVIIYPDSYRKFDEKREKHSVTVNNVTLTKAYNEKAHEDSIKQVFSFLGN